MIAIVVRTWAFVAGQEGGGGDGDVQGMKGQDGVEKAWCAGKEEEEGARYRLNGGWLHVERERENEDGWLVETGKGGNTKGGLLCFLQTAAVRSFQTE